MKGDQSRIQGNCGNENKERKEREGERKRGKERWREKEKESERERESPLRDQQICIIMNNFEELVFIFVFQSSRTFSYWNCHSFTSIMSVN